MGSSTLVESYLGVSDMWRISLDLEGKRDFIADFEFQMDLACDIGFLGCLRVCEEINCVNVWVILLYVLFGSYL